jgi:uncharacterized short protein YbdD (DUF466 family)
MQDRVVGRGSTLSRLTSILRQVTGMPDHARYLEHMQKNHPDQQPLSEGEFFSDYVRRRYADGPTRCC